MSTSLNPVQVDAVGNCEHHPEPNVFYPERYGGVYEEVAAQAKAVCHGCPLLLECLYFSLITEDPFGVWGGFSARERNSLRRRRTLDHYRRRRGGEEVQHLRGTRHWDLIEQYLQAGHPPTREF